MTMIRAPKKPAAERAPDDTDAQVRVATTRSFEGDEGIREMLLERLNAAERSIYLEAFAVADRQVIEALGLAIPAGLRLPIVYNTSAYDGAASLELMDGIVDIQLGYLHDRLAERDIRIHLSDAARDKLADAGFDPVYGARPLKRAIQQQLENPLAQEILAGKYMPGDTICIDIEGNRLAFSCRAQAEVVD